VSASTGAMAMDREAIAKAARLFAQARRSGDLVDPLPEPLRPRNADEAYAIQLAAAAELGDAAAGWKVAASGEYELLFAVLLRSLVFANGAAISTRRMAMIGVEGEIAFRFQDGAPPRERAYDRAEVEAIATAFPAIEIVDSRFKDYAGASAIDRAADFMSNGAFVIGDAREDWRSFDLAKLEARMTIDGVEVVRQVGGHASGDPLLPAIALCNRLRSSSGVGAGQIVTTGTFTGLQFVKRTSVVRADFVGFGGAHCHLVA
jgi:2-keto-4-pentenoate hydratase